ncbi:MAG: hypothetical protein H0V70_21485 [Ktedonobacteraceae bacterium]|nr:hypothetical protein [Ktedonobacteraceae bacterium]
MSSTLYASVDTTFEEDIFNQKGVETRNIYITEPMPAVKWPVSQLPDEEELHTSFEEAISDRLLALHSRLSRLSNPTLAIHNIEPRTDADLFTTAPAQVIPTNHTENVSHFAWKRATIFACSATMFLLLGFDLMGFLVLHIH